MCRVKHSISTKTFNNVCPNTAASHSYRMRWPGLLSILEYPIPPPSCTLNLNRSRTILVTIAKYCTFSNWRRTHYSGVWTYPFWWIKKGEGGSSDTWLVFLQLRITHWKKSLISTELETNEHWKLPKNVHILTDADKNCEVPTVATHKYNKHH